VRAARYGTCLRSPGSGSTAAARRLACGWTQLRAVRRGDLLGLPFLALAAALLLVLVYKIGNSSVEERLLKPGDARADDPMI